MLDEVRANSGLTVIRGDSGIGKSAILQELRHGWREEDAVPGARLLAASRGSVQSAIVEELAEVLWEHASRDPGTLADTWKGAISVFDQAASATAKGVARALIQGVYSALDRRLGPEVGAAARALGKLALEPSGGLEVDLAAAATGDVATQIIALATRVADVAERRVVLRLDQGEVIHDDDLRLLGDLAERDVPE
ncbi:MAG: hypothetical protein M3Y31_09020, partial [Gemmatimonadota bacterium]|nr:hypothetical protein [Gemmatimonadota bacterium]